MNTYILLRNNKESRPLSLEGLQQTGLKPTDLIWIECQSVCWQHPYEIKELKALVAEVSDNSIGNPVISLDALPVQSHIPKLNEEKIISENLPVDSATANKESIGSSFKAGDTTDMYKYGGVTGSVTTVNKKKEDSIETNYNRPLSEIKEMYVKSLEEKRNRRALLLNFRIPEQYKKAVLYTALVAAGALIMLLIKNRGNNAKVVTAQNTTPLNQEKSVSEEVSTDAVNYEIANEIQDAEPIKEPTQPPPEEKSLTLSIKNTSTPDKSVKPSVNKDIENGIIEKNIQPDKEVPVSTKISPENFSSLVSVKANEYEVGSFGGIRNLEMTLQNDSKYALDKVTVELKYLNPEGIILKTENIHFKSVQPGSHEKVAVNKSKRGVKIAYTILKIEPKETTTTAAGF